MIPYTYGDSNDNLLKSTKYSDVICVVDVSFGEDTYKIMKGWKDKGKDIIWIDHHKGVLEEADKWDIVIPGIRKIGTAACELTYNFFFGECPLIIKYLSAYDVWDKKRYDWDDVFNIQYAMRSKIGLCVYTMEKYINKQIDNMYVPGWEEKEIDKMIEIGKAITTFLFIKNKGEVKNYSFIGEIDGHRAICMNTLESNSTTFKSIDPEYMENENIEIMMPFAVLPNGLVKFSLYNEEGKPNCCNIANRFGGGGHAGAAGFQLKVDDKKFLNFLKTHKLVSDENKSLSTDIDERHPIPMYAEATKDKSNISVNGNDSFRYEIPLNNGTVSSIISLEEYKEEVLKFEEENGDKGRWFPYVRNDIALLPLTNPKMKEAFFKGEDMGGLLFNIKFDPLRKDGTIIDYLDVHPGDFVSQANPYEFERNIIVSGAKYEKGCIIYTGNSKDKFTISQEGKKTKNECNKKEG